MSVNLLQPRETDFFLRVIMIFVEIENLLLE